MDDYREFQEKAAEKSRTLIQKENMLVGTRLDRMNESNRPEGYDEQKYSVASAQSAITTVDRLLNLPQSKLWLSDMDRYQLRLRQNRDKSHVLLNAHKFVGDSTRMSGVKDALENLEKFLAKARNTTDPTNASERQNPLDLEALEQADALYNTALEKCQDYIEHKNPWFSKGKERLRMVKEAKERIIQERVQLTEAKKILEDDAGAFAQETCIRDVLLKGQAKINTKKTDANTPAPENLKWSDFGAILRGKLNGFVTFSGNGLTDATSDSETIENRKVKERLVELVKESIGKNKNGSYLISKDLEVRIRARLGIDNAAFESAPLSKAAVKEIRDMVAEEDSLVTSILRGPSACEKEKPEENAPMIRQALAKTVDRYIGTKLEAVSLSNTQEERVENTREELVSIIEKAGQYGTKVTALTQEQLDKVVMYDTGKLRDMLFSQLEDVYTMATIISGDHMTYKGIANQKQLIIPIAALLISKVATQENPLDALVNDTELALKKRELAFTMAADAQRRKGGEEKEQLIERVEKMKLDVENMALLQELSCMGSKGLDDLVNQSDLNQNDPDLKDGIKNLKILAENLRKLKEFENSALQNGVEGSGFIHDSKMSGYRFMAKTIKNLFADLTKIDGMQSVVEKFPESRFAKGFQAAKSLFIEQNFEIEAHVERLIGCQKPPYQKAVFERSQLFSDKTVEEQDQLLLEFSAQEQLVLSSFMLRDDFSKLISGKKDKKAKDIAHVKDVLKTFKIGKAYVEDVSIGTTTFTLVQKENNDLYIVMDHKQVPLSFGAGFLASKIEQSITQNTDLYGKNERNNVLKDADQADVNDDVLTLRSLYINVLSREAKCTTEELSHLLISDLRHYSNELVNGTMTGEAVRKAVRKKYQSARINGAEALEIMRMAQNISANDLKEVVEYRIEQKKEEKKTELFKQDLIEEKEWSPDELAVRNFVSDIIFSEETWQADELTAKPGMRLLEVVKKHADVVAKLAVYEDLLPKVLRHLPLPGESIESLKNGTTGGIKEQITKALTSLLKTGKVGKTIQDTLDQCRDKTKEAQVKRLKSLITGGDMVNSAVNAISQLLPPQNAQDQNAQATNQLIDLQELAKMEEEIDHAVTQAVNSIQETTINLAKEMFGEDENTEYRYDEQPKRMFQDLLTHASILDNAHDDAALKTALCKLLKKHSGGMIQCMYKPGCIRDFLKDLPEPENKEERKKFDAAKKKLEAAIGQFGELLADKNGYDIRKDHNAEQPEDKKKGVRSNDAVRTKFEGLVDSDTDALLEQLMPAVQEVAQSLREEVKDPKEVGITEEDKKERIEAGGRKLNRIIAQTATGDRGQGKFIKLVFFNYFKDVKPQDKRAMLASAIRGAKSLELKTAFLSSDEKKMQNALDSAVAKNYIGGFLKGAGPLLQKLLQGMPTAMLPPELKSAVEDMKSNLSPIPEKIVQAQMLAIVRGSKGKIKKIQVEQSLGAASVGQAFLCRLFGPGLPETGKEVVIKLLRPDVRNRMLREKKVMLQIAGKTDENHGMKDTYAGMLERIEEELDLTMEASNIKKGEIYNSEDKRVESVKLSDIIAPSPTVMVMERAPGVTLDQYIRDSEKEINALFDKYLDKNDDHEPKLDAYGRYEIKITSNNIKEFHKDREALAKKLQELTKRQKHLIELSKKWVQEGVFGKGFYHGDLHSGNIMVSDEKATVIDFGNATTLTSDQQTQIIRMISAAAVGDWEGFRSGYHALLPKDNEHQQIYQRNREKLGQIFQEVFKLGDFKYSGQRIGAALLRAQELGLQLPAAIQNFSQCQLRLQNAVEDINAQIEMVQKNLVAFDSAQPVHSNLHPELVIRYHYDQIGDKTITTGKLGKEYRRMAIPDDEQYKTFSKLLNGTDERKRAKFEETYMADYRAMKEIPDDYEFLHTFYRSILEVTDKKQRTDLLKGDKKNDYDRCLEIIKKHNIFSKDHFKRLLDDPSSYWKSQFQVALEDFGKKAEKLRAANVTEQYETLLQEFRSFQEQNPNAAKEELEEKKRALFDEYKKVQEVHFMIVGPLSNAVEMLTEMGAQFWERKESGGKEEPSFIEKELQPLFDDKDCKGDELQQCYNAYVDAIKPLEKTRKETEVALRKAEEDPAKKWDIKVKREETEELKELRKKFLDAYRNSAALRFKKLLLLQEKYSYLYTQKRPDNFLDVMGSVIRSNLTAAVYKLGSYVWKYRKELIRQNNG